MKLGMINVKELLLSDPSFRTLFPDLKKEIDEFFKNPSCACNAPLYRKMLAHPGMEKYQSRGVDPEITIIQSRFGVINCFCDDLEKELRKLPPGVSVEGITRFQNEITCIVRIKE